MKKTVLLLLALFSAVLFSCGKKNDPTPSSDGDATWKLGANTYVRGASSQTSTPAPADGIITGIAVTTSGDGGNYGAFSGSTVTITFYNHGEGQYTLGTTEMATASPTRNIIVIDCTVGTAVSTGAVLYGYSAAGTATVTKDKDGQYHVSLPATTLTKKLEIGGGIPGAKATYELALNGVY
nr:hypothetical protein [uncultured Chitinophaga sp.]